MNRRQLIAAVPALTAGGFLTACAGTTKQDLDRLAAVVGELDVALRGMVPQLERIPGMTPAVMAKIVFYIDTAADLARQIAVAVDMNAAKPPAQQFVTYVNLIIVEVEKFSLTDQMRKILDAVQLALPIIVAILQGA